jgi:hypothetical protein
MNQEISLNQMAKLVLQKMETTKIKEMEYGKIKKERSNLLISMVTGEIPVEILKTRMVIQQV